MKEFGEVRRTRAVRMLNAALVCSLVAFLVLVNIEAWRRRTVARQVVDSRRTAARERAWQAVGHLDRDA